MTYLRIGSGDTSALLSGKGTKTYADLWRKFLSSSPPHYNAYASPIDALRTGAILEDIYAEQRTDLFDMMQEKYVCKEYDVLVSSIDFTKYNEGVLIGFEEVKTIWLTDFIDLIRPASELGEIELKEFLIKNFKSNYNQVQFQLLCTGLEEATLVFIAVTSYDDAFNYNRIIEDNEVIKFQVKRDDEVINLIRERAKIFQTVKNDING